MATIKKAQTGIKQDSVKQRKTNLDALNKISDDFAKKKLDERLKNLANNEKQYQRQSVATPKKKMKNGGSLSSLDASTKRDKGIDPKGAYTTVQKKTLAGAKGKAKLTADKQLGATKMQNGGSVGSKVVKENPRQQKRLSRIRENNPERAERVEKRMVKRADRAMGARGAASRMKSGGSVKKK